MIDKTYQTVKIEYEKDGIAWVIFNRPEKRNAMSPTFHAEMWDALMRLNVDRDTRLVILTGAGKAFSAGQDLKEYFRELDGKPFERAMASHHSHWRNELLFLYNKPTIAMVNGFCVGGAFTQTICCDFAIAANEAIFCLSEVNWGILPGGMVSKMVADTLSPRDAMFYACTGRTFDGKEAARMRLVDYSVPLKSLKKETLKFARELLSKNPNVLRGTKHAVRLTRFMDWQEASDYLAAKAAEIKQRDSIRGHDAYQEGIRQFIDEKAYKPVYSPYHGASDTKAPSHVRKRAAAQRVIMKRKTAKKSTAKKTRKTVRRKRAVAKSATARKTTKRKTTARKPAKRKTAAKKATTRKTTKRKTTARKPAKRKTAAKKATTRKTTKRKTTRKSAAKK